jgi:hypothetical protein
MVHDQETNKEGRDTGYPASSLYAEREYEKSEADDKVHDIED